VRLAANPELDEVARARPEVPPHPLGVPHELDGREVRERVDRADCAVEGAAEVEVGHVGEDDLRAARAGELDHCGRAVDPDRLEPAPRQRLEHATGPAARLEDGPALRPEPLEEPVDLVLDVPLNARSYSAAWRS
jgi:hypothetical protein